MRASGLARVFTAALCATALSGCQLIECAVLCEHFVAPVNMHNPTTGEKASCGPYVGKGDVSPEERRDMAKCVANREKMGFVLDSPGNGQKTAQ